MDSRQYIEVNAINSAASQLRLRAMLANHGVEHEAFAIAKQFEARDKVAQFVVLQQKARISRMTDLSLVDKESLGQQNPSRFERAHEMRK